MTLNKPLGILTLLFLAGCGSKQATAPDAAKPVEQEAAKTPEVAKAPELTLPRGTMLHVRLAETLDTTRNRTGDRFTATLDSPVTVNGDVAVPKGANLSGRVEASAPSGRLKGRAIMNLTLDSLELNGKKFELTTSHAGRASGSHKKRNIGIIGGTAAAGALIGALAGGPSGAAIGAGAGAGAGTAAAAFTGKKNVRIPAETRLSFELRTPVKLS
jgi:hypothetical protein